MFSFGIKLIVSLAFINGFLNAQSEDAPTTVMDDLTGDSIGSASLSNDESSMVNVVNNITGDMVSTMLAMERNATASMMNNNSTNPTVNVNFTDKNPVDDPNKTKPAETIKLDFETATVINNGETDLGVKSTVITDQNAIIPTRNTTSNQTLNSLNMSSTTITQNSTKSLNPQPNSQTTTIIKESTSPTRKIEGTTRSNGQSIYKRSFAIIIYQLVTMFTMILFKNN